MNKFQKMSHDLDQVVFEKSMQEKEANEDKMSIEVFQSKLQILWNEKDHFSNAYENHKLELKMYDDWI